MYKNNTDTQSDAYVNNNNNFYCANILKKESSSVVHKNDVIKNYR